jgi:hypothetical protein
MLINSSLHRFKDAVLSTDVTVWFAVFVCGCYLHTFHNVTQSN